MLHRRNDGRLEVLVAHRPRYDDWSLPKGKLNRKERFEAAAVREVREETGMKGSIVAPIGTIAYVTPAGNHKIVRYWLMEAAGGAFEKNPEVDEIRWLTPKQARARLTYPIDRAVLNRATELLKRSSSSRIYVVRHALAGDRKQWTKRDSLRPLSKRGFQQASQLRDALSTTPLSRIVTSPYVRCEQSVAPLASAIGVHLETTRALAEEASPKQLRKLISRYPGESVVVCSHGDNIMGLVADLASRGVKLEGPLEAKKGSVWVFDVRSARVKRGTYLPPP